MVITQLNDRSSPFVFAYAFKYGNESANTNGEICIEFIYMQGAS